MATEPSWWLPEPADWSPSGVESPSGVRHWAEIIDLEQPGSGMVFTRDDAAATLMGYIPILRQYAARKQFLGCVWADEAFPWKLHRVNPLQHPNEPQLYCISFDFVEWTFTTIDVPDSDPVTYTIDVPAEVANTLPTRVRYNFAKTTVKFRPHNFPFFSDSYMESFGLREYFRNCSVFDSCDPQVQTLAAGGDPFLKWTDTPTDPLGPQPIVDGKPNSVGLDGAETSIIVTRVNLVLIWHAVPMDYICDQTANQYVPKKILDCVGKVNGPSRTSPPWFGIFPPGTLLCDSPKFRRTRQAHIRTDGTIPFVCDVMFNFVFYDPVMAAVTSGGGTPKFRGHNSFPWKKTAEHYAAARVSAPGKGLYEYADFDSMFDHVRA